MIYLLYVISCCNLVLEVMYDNKVIFKSQEIVVEKVSVKMGLISLGCLSLVKYEKINKILDVYLNEVC